MNREQLVDGLIGLWFRNTAESTGVSPHSLDAAVTDALQTIGPKDIDAWKRIATLIVEIMETYLNQVTQLCIDHGGTTVHNEQQIFAQAHDATLEQIEHSFRNIGAKVQDDYPRQIDEYVYYRLCHSLNNDLILMGQIGLTREVAKILTHTAGSELAKMHRQTVTGQRVAKPQDKRASYNDQSDARRRDVEKYRAHVYEQCNWLRQHPKPTILNHGQWRKAINSLMVFVGWSGDPEENKDCIELGHVMYNYPIIAGVGALLPSGRKAIADWKRLSKKYLQIDLT